MVMGELVYRKGGSDTWAVSMLNQFVLTLGHPRVALKSDSEPAIVDLKNRVASSLRGEGLQVHIEHSTDSQEGGLAEHTVKELKAQCRVLACSVQEIHGELIGPRHPILPWLIRHAAGCINRGQLGHDGRTPHERLKGVPYRRQLPPFSEVVHARDVTKDSRITMRWFSGLFLGLVPRSNQLYVSESNGHVVPVRTIRRCPPSERKSVEMLKGLVGAPVCDRLS
eukprot:873851-Amphidinium_carterae.2